ncbi:MAG: hypothetical protein KatS3mg131_3947 [Candidatus Tectimicrobiota bacterium]|nr:MAG: hypothetical protein KatS3mg131_3947 [Candidatus Tectomicrobia bacterium]
MRLRPSREETTAPLLHLETLGLYPQLPSLLLGPLRAALVGELYGGTLAGEVQRRSAGEGGWQVHLRLSDIDVARYPLLQANSPVQVQGRLAGEVTATLDESGRPRHGTLAFTVQPARFTKGQRLGVPLPEELACTTLEGQLRATAGVLHVLLLRCEGDDLQLEARGTVRWRHPLAASQLDLRVQVRSQATFRQHVELLGTLVRRRPDARGALSFRLQGTLQRPHLGA